MKPIFQGAEATIYLDKKFILKDRAPKKYRLAEIDSKIKKQRTKAETKLLLKASQIINSPKPVETENNFQIKMPFINGERLSNYLNGLPLQQQRLICKKIGTNISKLHEAEIIHGDLTTSNMILTKDKKVFFIDFGLGYISSKIEDKAVDLHLLKQALEAKHFQYWEILFKEVEKSYSKNKDYKKVLEQLNKVEKRGRYRH